MSDNKIREKVWVAFLRRYLAMSHGWSPSPGLNTRVSLRSWTVVIERCGCDLLPYTDLQEDTEECIYIRDVAIGNIRVPREIAMRILVLGDLP